MCSCYNSLMATVLLVEDDSLLGDLFETSLHSAKLDVTLAITAEEALVIVREKHYDIILLDIILPGMSGLEFLSLIKKDPELKDIPVIIISNLSDIMDINKGKELGAVHYFIKSNVTPNEIIKKVYEVLG